MVRKERPSNAKRQGKWKLLPVGTSLYQLNRCRGRKSGYHSNSLGEKQDVGAVHEASIVRPLIMVDMGLEVA